MILPPFFEWVIFIHTAACSLHMHIHRHIQLLSQLRPSHMHGCIWSLYITYAVWEIHNVVEDN